MAHKEKMIKVQAEQKAGSCGSSLLLLTSLVVLSPFDLVGNGESCELVAACVAFTLLEVWSLSSNQPELHCYKLHRRVML